MYISIFLVATISSAGLEKRWTRPSRFTAAERRGIRKKRLVQPGSGRPRVQTGRVITKAFERRTAPTPPVCSGPTEGYTSPPPAGPAPAAQERPTPGPAWPKKRNSQQDSGNVPASSEATSAHLDSRPMAALPAETQQPPSRPPRATQPQSQKTSEEETNQRAETEGEAAAAAAAAGKPTATPGARRSRMRRISGRFAVYCHKAADLWPLKDRLIFLLYGQLSRTRAQLFG